MEEKRADLAAVPREVVLDAAEVAEIAAIGDNTGSMALKGGSPEHAGSPLADRWPLDEALRDVAARWGIEPERDLVRTGSTP